jgi:hypothetical protein
MKTQRESDAETEGGPAPPTAWITISETEFVNPVHLRRITIGGDESVTIEFVDGKTHTYPLAADRFLDAIGRTKPAPKAASGEDLP